MEYTASFIQVVVSIKIQRNVLLNFESIPLYLSIQIQIIENFYFLDIRAASKALQMYSFLNCNTAVV